jgi:hypothetical protein
MWKCKTKPLKEIQVIEGEREKMYFIIDNQKPYHLNITLRNGEYTPTVDS